MFLTSNKKSILLAVSIALSCGIVQAQSDTEEIAINFEAWVGEQEFVCGESYESVGVAQSNITPTDFRFYVSDVALIDENGNTVPLELEQDGKWQYQNVALLDFEDGTSTCDNGTAETRTMVLGTIPEGDYQSLQFTLGVPKTLNHDDAAISPSPLNLTSLWWNWQGGYKFLRVDIETEQAISNVSSTNHNQTTHSQGGHGNVQVNQQTTDGNHQGHQNTSSNTYLIHLGSTGCADSAQSNLFGCTNPNRANVTLEDFDSEKNIVIADLAKLLAQSDLSTNQANTPNGCMSSPEDDDCAPIMESLSLSAGTTTKQNFFFIK